MTEVIEHYSHNWVEICRADSIRYRRVILRLPFGIAVFKSDYGNNDKYICTVCGLKISGFSNVKKPCNRQYSKPESGFNPQEKQ